MAKILVVDDEPIIRDRMKGLLELDEYEVYTAEDGPSGIKAFQEKNPDITLLDVKMPGMDGIEVLEKIKALSTHVEVIILTGHGGLETAIQAMQNGAFGYMTKPVDYDELNLNIKRALERQGLRQKLDQHVHDLEEAHNMLKSQQAQIVQAAKLTAVGQLGAGVAHEMNQPLMAISAYMESVLMHAAVTANVDLKEKIMKLKDQLVRLGTIVKRMHEYAGNRHAQMTLDDPNRPAQDGFFLFRQQLDDRNIRASLAIEENLPKVNMDRYQIQDIIINFIVNARDAVEDRFQQKEGAEMIVVSKKLPSGRGVLLGVIDNGIPVKPGTEQDLFNPFFTTKAPGKGTGLGLSVSYGIIKNHNGFISFAPLSNERKIFYCVLPIGTETVASTDSAVTQEVKELVGSL